MDLHEKMLSKLPAAGIYPAVPTEATAPSVSYTNGHRDDHRPEDITNYRLNKISEIETSIKLDMSVRQNIRKKYKRSVNIFEIVSTILTIGSVGAGVGSVTLLSTIIGSPIGFCLGVGSASVGVLKLGSDFIRRKLETKVAKHTELILLCEIKLNSLSDSVSRALTDGHVTEDEFSNIIHENEKYVEMKLIIKKKFKKSLKEIKTFTKEDLLRELLPRGNIKVI